MAGGAWHRLHDRIYDANPAVHIERDSLDPESNMDFVYILASYESKVLLDSSRLAMNTGESETLDLGRKWMHNCISSHTSCAAHRRPDWAPTRLLKVFAQDDGKVNAKLQEQAEHHYDSNVRYIALSHRWLGDNENPLLSQENRSAFSDNIEISSLKASIRDAICVTVHLGFQYLWVDTLCILQQNENDKKHEIGEMDSVYSNAICTIAAGVGETANEGCFTSRDPTGISTHGVYLRLGGEEAQYCLMRLSWSHTNRELARTSLSRRGWTFQERFLSPRILHFCAKQVHWECRQFRANETEPEKNFEQIQWNKDVGMAIDWAGIVESYTTRSLTFPTDRLRAIQGVADCLHRNSSVHGPPDKYLHGLWRSTLPQSLLWAPATPLKHDRQTKTAPTWSWASTTEQIVFVTVMWDAHPNEQIISVVDILEVLSGSDIRISDENREFETNHDVIKIRCRLTRRFDSYQGIDSVPRVYYGYRDAEKGGSKDMFLPVCKTAPWIRNGHRIEGFQGIVVRALDSKCAKVYERVGIYVQYCSVDGIDAPFGEEDDIYLC